MDQQQITIQHSDAFATRLWHVELNHLHAYEVEWLKKINELKNLSIGVKKSNRIGWQSNPDAHSEETFSPLFKATNQIFAAIFQAMGHSINFELEAWINVNPKGAINLPHIHPTALLSAVYYIHVSKNTGDIYFRDPRPGAVLSPFHGGVNFCPPNCTADIKIKPKKQMLLIFPSWLEHGVNFNEDEENRISIAINARPKTSKE